MTTTVQSGSGGRERAEQRSWLNALSDSGLERRFVDWLSEHGYRLPDDAQRTVSQAQARPDLVYDLPGNPVALFVDGPHHDDATQQLRDSQASERLENLGWAVVRVNHDEDWQSLVDRYGWLFGTGRTVR